MATCVNRLVALIAVAGLSWLGMMAVHEFGHVVGAVVTGGRIVRVVLHPAAISRTDVSPNPAPLAVAWCGPVFGCVIPWLILSGVVVALRRRVHPKITGPAATRNISRAASIVSLLQFFSGFCLIANGAYLGLGVFDGVGDAGDIVKAGSSPWWLIAFGVIAIAPGLAIWHGLGSPTAIIRGQAILEPWIVRGVVATLILVIIVEYLLSPG